VVILEEEEQVVTTDSYIAKASHILFLADTISRKDRERDIPTGQLWKDITHSHWQAARQELVDYVTKALIDEYEKGLKNGLEEGLKDLLKLHEHNKHN
jgi:hypothetical protein